MDMKEQLKNPMVYTLGIPALAALWMLYVWLAAYPSSLNRYDAAYKEFQEGQKQLEQILTLEPQRLLYQQDKGKVSEFDYTNVIGDFAKQFGIAPGDYTLVVRGATKRAGQTVKSADMSIKTIDFENLSKFVSAVLQRWPELECERLSIDKAAVGKNSWKVSLRFMYKY
jgi:hypothetical protein